MTGGRPGSKTGRSKGQMWPVFGVPFRVITVCHCVWILTVGKKWCIISLAMKRNIKTTMILVISIVLVATMPTIAFAGSSSDESTVYKHLTGKFGLNKAAACAVMTNLQAESGMRSDNLENLYNIRYGLSDAEYTKRVNRGIKKNGKYKSGFGKVRYFTGDYCGYGICQWTSLGRRKNLLQKARKKKVGVDNLNMQLEFLGEELKGAYPQVWTTLRKAPNNAEGAYLATAHFCISCEVPANTNWTAARRARKALATYWEKYSGKSVKTKGASYFGLCGYKYPKVIRKGTGFSLGGHAIANHRISSVTATVTNSKGKVVEKETIKCTSTAVALSNLSNGIAFRKLKAGQYTLKIRAKDSEGRVVSAKHTFKVAKGKSTSYARGFSNSNRAAR